MKMVDKLQKKTTAMPKSRKKTPVTMRGSAIVLAELEDREIVQCCKFSRSSSSASSTAWPSRYASAATVAEQISFCTTCNMLIKLRENVVRFPRRCRPVVVVVVVVLLASLSPYFDLYFLFTLISGTSPCPTSKHR